MIKAPPIKWIGTDGDFYPNRIDSQGRKHKPVAIVCHIMQGTLKGTDAHFNNPNVDASTHFGIGKSGEVHQYVDLKDAAWGNGLMNKPDLSIPWLKECWEKNINPNHVTISIEFEGMHSTTPQGWVKEPDWEPTEAQVQTAIQLIAWLCWQFDIKPSRETVVGHYQIDSVNKPFCPGPKFPFNRIIDGVKKLLAKEAEALFVDILNHWARKDIESFASRKTPDGKSLIQGRPTADGAAFMPDQPITRAEVVVLLERVLKYLGK